MRRRSSTILKLIALFRFVKAALLIAAGVGALRLLNPYTDMRVRRWLIAMPMAYEQRFAHRAIAMLAHVNPARVGLVAAGAFAYAALFITEGTGLWLEKRWAEVLTIVATASFLPFEIYEVVEKFSVLRLTILVLNAAILVYLVWRVRGGPD